MLTLGSCAIIPSSRTRLQSKRLNAKFNTLYNGEQALLKFLDQRNSSQNNLLEPLSPLPKWYFTRPTDTATNNSLERVEEKAVKAIQRFSIEVGQKEKNDRLDRAYELLGYSRYFNARPFPALEAFRKLRSYSNRSQAIAAGYLGEAFVFFSTKNYPAAEEALDKVEILAPIKWDQRYLALLLRSQIRLESQDPSAALKNLEYALEQKIPDSLLRRTQWVLAQLLQKQNQQVSSNQFLKQLAKDRSYRYAPYRILAQIALTDQENLNTEDYHKALDRMLKRWNNYEDRALIYRSKGLKELSLFRNDTTANDFLQNAISHFENSNDLGSPALQIANFDTLISFELQRRNYRGALSYLDSLLEHQSLIEPLKLEARKGAHKHISELFVLLDRATEIDTLLAYTELTEEERVSRITSKVRNEIEVKQKQERAEQLLAEMDQEENEDSEIESVSNFYFNNEQLLKSGKLAFEKQWGARSNVDYWSLRSVSPERAIADAEIKKSEKPDERVSAPTSVIESEINSAVAQKLGEIPVNQEAVDDLIKEKIEALFTSASIYYYTFEDYSSAVKLLEPLLEGSSDLIQANTLYTLYLISIDTDEVTAQAYKNRLLKEHPNSLFSRHLNSKGIETIALEQRLAKLYIDRKHQELRTTFDSINKAQLRISPSAALLFAKNEFKIAGLEAFEKALEQLRLLYPNSYLSREAIQTLKVINLQSKKAANSNSAKNRVSLVLDVSKMTSKEQVKFQSRLSEALKAQNYLAKAYLEQFDADHTLAVLHRFFETAYIQEFIDNNAELLSLVPLYVLTESEYIAAYQTKNWAFFYEKQV
ncbi:MAG: hypothetical protein DA439_05875, partial [Bacteroidetes bacterium]